MQIRTVPHNRPTLGLREAWAAARTVCSRWVAQGPEVAAFENDLCRFLELPAGHAVCVSSGTAALFLSLKILGCAGQQVAMPAYACSSLRHAAAFAGAKELLLDCAVDSPNIDSDALNRQNPYAVIVPHMYGIPADVRKIDSKVLVIEDCAQSIGARIGGSAAGTLGHISVFSFSATKLMTSGGQGGAIVSRDKAVIARYGSMYRCATRLPQ
jgi:perosamine synthetase